MTVGAGSFHSPHPDPAYMGLTIGQGDEDSPVLWGHWNGEVLTVQRLIEDILLGVSPSGELFLTTDPGGWSLHLHRAADGTELRRLDAEAAMPPPAGDDRPKWEYDGAFSWDDAAVVGTEEPRHWLVDLATMAARGPITYPFAVSGPARSAGPGTWYTVSPDSTAVHLWKLASEGPSGS
ncbi:hypothetical protein [Actinoplanes regularis]|uniref:hypothetical protein n=1 Tax=Actinoplanes regularis TaxID=52697 RepID=UPI002553E416|nr:hypothetical protein [Actinoplanes regularis]